MPLRPAAVEDTLAVAAIAHPLLPTVVAVAVVRTGVNRRLKKHLRVVLSEEITSQETEEKCPRLCLSSDF
jgi:hypothetical protein